MKLGFIGAGKMATALARGVLRADLCVADDLIGSGRSKETRDRFATQTGGVATDDNAAVVEQSDVVFLCVKPAQARAVLQGIAPVLHGTVVVSVVAGVTLADLQAAAGGETPIIRAMPNTPCLVGRGAISYASGNQVTNHQSEVVARLFKAVGEVYVVPESLLDAVNGVSGSGPAYVYLVIEALADGGVLMGLPRPLAASLAAQTVLGAAAMVCETGLHPAELREAVASPGGTTMAALEALERNGVRAGMMAAVRAATERAREMAR